MFKFFKTIARGLVVTSFLLIMSFVATAQNNPVYLLNQQEVNLKAGVSIAELLQEKDVALSLDEASVATGFDTLVVYLARGNRPLVQQKMQLGSHKSMEISRELQQAKSGDRLVLELIPKDEKESNVTTLFLF